MELSALLLGRNLIAQTYITYKKRDVVDQISSALCRYAPQELGLGRRISIFVGCEIKIDLDAAVTCWWRFLCHFELAPSFWLQPLHCHFPFFSLVLPPRDHAFLCPAWPS